MTDSNARVANNPESLYRCLYYSRARRPLSDSQLTELEQLCLEKNTQHHVTGYLVYYEECFVQYIEGSHRAILTLMDNIARDDRHDIKVRLEEYMDTGRLFPRWHMRFFTRLTDSDMEGVLFVHLATMSEFRHDQKSERVAWNLVDIMQQIARIANGSWHKPDSSPGGLS